MLCDEVMSRNVECVSPTVGVQDVARQMAVSDIGFMPIVDEEGKVIGSVTDRDLTVRVLADGMAPNTTVGSVMTALAVTCRPQQEVQEAESIMREQKISRIICVDDAGCVVGFIALSDLLSHGQQQSADATLEAIKTPDEAL